MMERIKQAFLNLTEGLLIGLGIVKVVELVVYFAVERAP